MTGLENSRLLSLVPVPIHHMKTCPVLLLLPRKLLHTVFNQRASSSLPLVLSRFGRLLNVMAKLALLRMSADSSLRMPAALALVNGTGRTSRRERSTRVSPSFDCLKMVLTLPSHAFL